MGTNWVRETVRDPLAPIAAMAVAALLALGTGVEAGGVEDAWQRASAEEGVVVSAVGKVYTPRLVIDGAAVVGDATAAPDACTTAVARAGQLVALLPAPSSAAGT